MGIVSALRLSSTYCDVSLGATTTQGLSATIKCKSTGPRVTWDDRKKVKIIHTRIYNTSPAWVCVYYVYDDGDIADYRNREHMLLTSDQLNPLERFFTTFIMYKNALYERWITLKIKKNISRVHVRTTGGVNK